MRATALKSVGALLAATAALGCPVAKAQAPAGAASPLASQPRVLAVRPEVGSTLAERGAIALQLGRALPAGVAPQAQCDVAGLRSGVPTQALAGAARERALAALGVSGAEAKADAAQPWIVLRCLATLPDGAPLSLRWLRAEPVPSGEGLGAGVQDWRGLRFDYRALSAWPVAVQCNRSNAATGCNPLEPVRLVLTQSVEAEDLAALRLRGPRGERIAPKPFATENSRWPSEIEFPRLAAGARYTVQWPARLRNQQGQDLLAAARREQPLVVAMGPYPPLVKFGASFGIVEAGQQGEGVVPLTVRAIESWPVKGVGRPARVRSIRVTDEAAMLEAFQTLRRLTRLDDSRASSHEGWGEDGGFDGDPEPVTAAMAGTTPNAAVSTASGKKAAPRFPFAWPRPDDEAADTRSQPWLGRLSGELAGHSRPLPRALEGRAFEVLGLPLRGAGLHLLEVESPRLGRDLLASGQTMYVRSGALVTDLAVHLHLGERQAALWVTRLSSGQPVAQAALSLRDCRGNVLATATSDAQGAARMALKTPPQRWSCPVYAFARVGGDVSFVASNWQRGIESWRFDSNERMWADSSERIAHAVFARNLLRPGETLHARLVWRTVGPTGELSAPPPASLPAQVALVHEGSDERVNLPVRWDARGNAELTWPLPQGVKRGTWSVEFASEEAGRWNARPSSFRIEEFRLPVLKAEVAAGAQTVVLPRIEEGRPAKLAVPLRLSYLAGGGAGGETVQIAQRLLPFTPSFDAYPGFWFGSGDRWRNDGEDDGGDAGLAVDGEAVGRDRPRKLGPDGTLAIETTLSKPLAGPRTLLTEMEYRDPNGETYRAQGRTPLWPAGIVLGIRGDGWSAGAERKVELVALGPDGRPVAGVAVAVQGAFDGWFVHRRKTVGGFYSYHSERVRRDPQPLCQGSTDARGRFDCRYKPASDDLDSGEFRLRATATDAQGRSVQAMTTAWIYAGGEIWFGAADHDRMDVLADKERYAPGDTATLQVRSPFREATAWVSVLRGGAVVDTLVLPLSGSEPTLKIPIKPAYAPNAFFNVLAVRGRVAEPAPTALVDLARPAFKLGIVAVDVAPTAQALTVKVATDKPRYQPRDKARVTIQVEPAPGVALPAEREVTVAVVDEALLELWPNNSWKLLEAMTARRGYDFETASAAMQVVGRRHYGRKALPPGGGGGRSATRELFDTLLLWRATVPLDAQGRAQLEVPVNDSLTRFRVVAVAQAGVQQFGTGSASFTSAKDLQLLSGLPATVREGDRFAAGVTVRNASAAAMQASVQASVQGGMAPLALPAQSVALAAGEAKTLSWPLEVPAEATELRWQIDASATGAEGPRRDALAVKQAVGNAWLPLRWSVATTVLGPTQAEREPAPIAVRPPAESLPGRSELLLSLSPTLAADASGVRAFMRGYPFFCLEQRTSKAVSLKDTALWAFISERLDSYVTATGLVAYYPGQAGVGGEQGYDGLTALVLSAAHEAGWRLPEEPQRRMLDALEAFLRGKLELRHDGYGRQDAEERIERKIVALEALSRWRKPAAALADSLPLGVRGAQGGGAGGGGGGVEALSNRALVLWLDVLNRVEWPDRAARQAQALAELERRLVDDGRAGLRLRARPDDRRWWFMSSDAGTAVRVALLALDWPALAPRAERLARGAVNLQRGGNAWWDTQANVWGSLMLDKRAARAAAQVNGRTTLTFGANRFEHDWAQQPQGQVFRVKLPATATGAPVGSVVLRHQGAGSPVAQLTGEGWSAPREPFARQATLRRELTPIRQQKPGQWSVGDVVQVRLFFTVPAGSGWIVLSDAIPPGSTVLGSGLGGQGELPTGAGNRRGWRQADGSWEAWPAYVERGFTHVRAYYEHLWGERQTLTYQLRLNTAGVFALPPSDVQAMYDPDIHAIELRAPWEVK